MVVYVVVCAVVYAVATACSFSACVVDCERLEVCVWSPAGCLDDKQSR